jgi:hypothetical protein
MTWMRPGALHTGRHRHQGTGVSAPEVNHCDGVAAVRPPAHDAASWRNCPASVPATPSPQPPSPQQRPHGQGFAPLVSLPTSTALSGSFACVRALTADSFARLSTRRSATGPSPVLGVTAARRSGWVDLDDLDFLPAQEPCQGSSVGTGALHPLTMQEADRRSKSNVGNQSTPLFAVTRRGRMNHCSGSHRRPALSRFTQGTDAVLRHLCGAFFQSLPQSRSPA